MDNAALDLEVDGTGKKLSEVLKTSIVPQTVQNLLASYPAFGYLKGSSIGIGLRLYNDPGDNTMASVTCGGGALIVGGGTGTIGTGTAVIVDGAAVAAGGLTGVKNSANTSLEKYEIDWSKLSKLTGGQLTSVSVDGIKKGMLLDPTDPGVLWLDKRPDGSGGIEGTNREFDGDTNTLKILTDTALTIKGGTKTVGGETDHGTIKIEDNVNAKLTLDGVEIDASKLGGNTAGIQLGNGSDVKLTVRGTNTITGSGEAAGIQLYGKRKRTGEGTINANGGNIGGYDPNGKEIKVSMPDPNDLTIKAGLGEGMYITTGTFDKDGNQLFAFELGYLNKLLGNSGLVPPVTSVPPGSTTLVFPLSKITATMDDGTTYTWDAIDHMGEGDTYIWMKGQDPDPAPDPIQPDLTGKGGIILQIGTGVRDILAVPRFFLSRRALKLDKLDISTQSNAMGSMPIIREAVDRVSEIRGSYGALSNRLEHNITNLRVTSENLTDAESTLRDTDMAMEMTNYVKQSILSQASQAMLAQCNQRASDVMRLLQ